MAPVSRLAPVAIEALHQEHIGITHAGETAFRHLDALQIKGAMEAALRRRRFNAAAKAQRTATIIRPKQQQIPIAGRPKASMASDHPASPVIRQGIAECAKEAPQADGRTCLPVVPADHSAGKTGPP